MYVSSVMLSIQQFKNWGAVQKEHKQFHSNYSSLGKMNFNIFPDKIN